MQSTPTFQFHVSPTSGVPIYRQLMDQVRFQVASGRLQAGTDLPSVRKLAETLEINPMTVSKAYSLLEREGVLQRVRGLGMRVAAPAEMESPEARRQELEPLLRQVAAKAYQLSIPRRQVIAMLRQIMEASGHERVGSGATRSD